MTGSRKNKNPTTGGIIDRIWSQRYDSDVCFLCGEGLSEQSSSPEHVFPKWLQEKYGLWDMKVTILNKTKIPYRHLTIPCCQICNNKSLSKVENKVRKYSNADFEGIAKIDRHILFYWLGKIFYGLLYKELFLSNEMSNPKAESIVSPEFLQAYRSHLLLLQGIRISHEFQGFFPASFFFFETQLPDTIEEQWDFLDFHNGMAIAMRIGKTGIVAVLQNGDIQDALSDSLKDFYSVPLHPLQFREVASKIFYHSSLFNRTPKFISNESDHEISTMLMPFQGLSKKPLYEDWNTSDYAQILSAYVGFPKKDINPTPNSVMTWILDENDKVIFMDIEEYPLPWL